MYTAAIPTPFSQCHFLSKHTYCQPQQYLLAMQLTYATFLHLLSILSFTSAAGTCTSSGSLSWPPAKDCVTTPKYPTLVQTCRACCMNDQPCFTACLKAGGLRKRDAIGEPSHGNIRRRSEVERRAVALNCETNENCYKFTDGSLLCLNLGTGMSTVLNPIRSRKADVYSTGLYHDDVGGNGDYYSGKYTDPNGKVQTGTSAATATRAPVSSATSRATRSTAAAQVNTAGAATTSPSSAAAFAVAPTGAAYVAANIGLVGLVAGLVV